MNFHNRILFILMVGGALLPVGRAQYVEQGNVFLEKGSAAVSTNGNTAILGSMYSNYPAGSAMIFTRTNAAWSQQGGQLTGNAAYLGSAVGMSGDGNTVIVGGYGDNLG